MSRYLLCLTFLVMSFSVLSQKVYFVYLQAEPEQAFFVRINSSNKIYSSSASGYLILSKLRDTSYSISLGFPGNKWPEQNFTVSIKARDHGYLVKNFGEKGWGLFNLQDLSVQMSSSGGAAGIQSPANKDNGDVSDFANVLSKAANDPSLKEKSAEVITSEKKNADAEVIKKTEPEPEPVKIVEKPAGTSEGQEVKTEIAEKKIADTLAGTVTEKKKEAPAEVKEKEIADPKEETVTEKEEVKKMQEEYKMSVVTRRSESSTTEGFGLVYTDVYDGNHADTIKILIPNPKPVIAPVAVKEEVKEEKKFLDILPADSPDSGKTKVVANPLVSANTENKRDCPAVADENDFLKIRKRMAAETTDDNMIAEAKKYFKTKCVTTSQLRNLSLLFLNEEGKYRFFDMGYPYVTDTGNFASLETELKDTYYINRFRALLR